MPSITLDIANIGNVSKRFAKLSEDVKANLKNEVNASALKIQSDAKKLAPANLGTLRGSIYKDEISKSPNEYMFIVGAAAKYAAYVEFGTGGKVSIPNGYNDYATQFYMTLTSKSIVQVPLIAILGFVFFPISSFCFMVSYIYRF